MGGGGGGGGRHTREGGERGIESYRGRDGGEEGDCSDEKVEESEIPYP